MKIGRILLWLSISLLGATSVAFICMAQNQPINALWFVTAALCTFAISYRFYSKWLVTKVLVLDEKRATPAVLLEDGRDYVKTNKWIVFGHHFAAIAGPGPLVGPVLAAQFGYLPGTLWILIGATLGGAVHDSVMMFCSLRRKGKSLGQMVREEVGPFAGTIAMVSILAIMVILIAVLGVVVVNALAESSWGLYTIVMTMPIALFMGCYLRFFRPHGVLEISLIGVVLLLAAVWSGQFIHSSPVWSKAFTWSSPTLAWAIIIYGLAASILPVWLLLTPRDYLSSFMKIGTVIILMGAIIWVAPLIKMPALTPFIHGGGLVLAGKVFPFVFITIACGAISGFHALIATGTTPKLVTNEETVRSIGYGAMVTEMVVAIMALIAACTMEPGQYFAMNTAGPKEQVIEKVNKAGFHVTAVEMQQLADDVKEETMIGRVGGAPTFAVGMAQMFAQSIGGKSMMSLWYHFAIMFEALFILTTIDAGTRVGRFLLQDLLGHVHHSLGNTSRWFPNALASILFVAAWGWFLYGGVTDPNGGIKALWPIFGIANQLLAVIALSLGTTVLLKMGRAKYCWVTLAPLILVLAVTMTAGVQKIFFKEAAGFLPAIETLTAKALTVDKEALRVVKAQIFNNKVNIAVTTSFMILVVLVVISNARVWWRILVRKESIPLREEPAVYS
ncbi:MAG: carbon starvation CstA family protein [Verrucomicrobiota bacterium]|nr:carbon starvation CstA family protein [Verrucomicrobiota bacterium]